MSLPTELKQSFDARFGLWLLPMGLLAYRSAMFPTIVGIALIVGSVAWLLDPVLTFIPGVPDVVREIVSIPTSIAEFGLILYLLIVGIRMPAAIPEPALTAGGRDG